MTIQEVFELFCDIMRNGGMDEYDLDAERWSDESIYDYDYYHISYLEGIDWVRSGASKIVIALDRVSDYVIKIPIYGSAKFNERLDAFEDEDKLNWKHDYCKLEADMYAEICDMGGKIKDMFAGTFYVGNYGCVPVYISEKVSMFVSSHEASDDSIHKAKRILKSCDSGALSLSVLGLVIDSWGTQMAEGLEVVLGMFKDCNDLCSRNMGRDTDNRVRFVDYSGFDY